MKKENEENIVENGVHDYTDPADYVVPTNKAVQEHLKQFMGYKLGFMMHWAPGCQMGTYESWALCNADGNWSQQDIDWTDDIEEFKQQYIGSNRTFNPVKFRPDEWAKLAKECGFQYLLFTTKHHDGFCMFDTKTTSYKITDPSCPFSTNKHADVVGSLYEEFRKQGLGISVYFSKPDWHSEYYWAKEFGDPADRNVNYDIEKHPELWEKFVQYTHEQLIELTSNYGKVDALWLDGGWVSPNNLGQDIRLGEVVEKIRATTQPDLIVCDRTVGGEYENILTPEQTVPDKPLTVPWESCVTLGESFSFHYTDHFKTPHELVRLLVEVVSRGGNLALNIAPQPDGKLPHQGVVSLRGLGEWLKVNGEGIYNTVICPEQVSTKEMAFTQTDSAIYLFQLFAQTLCKLPRYVTLPVKREVKKVTLLRGNEPVPFTQKNGEVTIHMEKVDMTTAKYGDCFRISF